MWFALDLDEVYIVTTHNRTQTLQQHMQSRISLVQKTMLISLLVFMSSLLALGTLTYSHMQAVAGEQHRHSQQQLGNQLAKLSAPLILRHDLISLNVSLQELIGSDTISGAAIFNADDKMLAKAGFLGSRNLEKFTIRSNDVLLGSLQIKISEVNLQPSWQALLQLMWPGTLALGLFSLIVGWWYGNRLYRPMQALHEAQEQLLLYERTPPLDDQRLDEWGILNLGFNSINEHRMLHAQTEQQFELDMPQGTGLPVIPASSLEQQDPGAFDHELHDLAKELSDSSDIGDPLLSHGLGGREGQSDYSSQAIDTEFTRQVPILTMDDLQFGGTPEDPDPIIDPDPLMDKPKATLANTPAPAGLKAQLSAADDNPLVSLLYINVNTRDQGPMVAEEKHQLLKAYQRLVDQVCAIYGGAIETEDNHDVLVTFDKPLEHMTHCVNALCAAQFFFGLYKAYNERRSQAGRPTLNIQIVVHTGPLDDSAELIQEAYDLSRQQRLDDMMISRQVAYHPELQQRVLELDNCQLLNNGAFSLTRLSDDYQDLLNMQISHFSASL